MRKIAIMSHKGGTGKTTTIVNLAHGLARAGKRVLVVDTDPQGSISYYFGLRPEKTLYDALMAISRPEECVISARDHLDVIAANERLFPAEKALSAIDGCEFVLSDRLASIQNYDFVLLDCAPSINLLNQNALVYADEVFVPVSMEYLSLMGVRQLLDNIVLVNRLLDMDIEITKVIPTFFVSRTNKSKDIKESLERVFPGRLTSPIRQCSELSASAGHSQTIFDYAPDSKGAHDYEKLTREVL